MSRSRSARALAGSSRLAALIVLALSGAPARATTVARLAVTAESHGASVPLPGPFAVLPGGDRVVLHVPASKGLLVLRGSELLQHLPLPPGLRVDDLDASRQLIVAGAPAARDRLTISLAVYDAVDGKLLTRVQSANPFLRIAPDSARSWRVVAGESLAGVFHPPTAASYPLWDRSAGILPSADQIGRALAGLGFDDDDRWVPNPDGSVGRRRHGRSETVLEAGRGRFLGGLSNGTVLVHPDDEPPPLPGRPGHLTVHAYRDGKVVGAVRLRVASRDRGAARGIPAERRVVVFEDRLYWMYVGTDFLEIRTIDPAVTLSGEY